MKEKEDEVSIDHCLYRFLDEKRDSVAYYRKREIVK